MKLELIIICFSLFIITTAIKADEYLDIAREAYMLKIEYLGQTIKSTIENYDKLEKDIISEVKRRNCIIDRAVLLKTAYTSAKSKIDILKQLAEQKNEESLEKQKMTMKKLDDFYKVYKKFFGVVADIDLCMLKLDNIDKEDGKSVVLVYKR